MQAVSARTCGYTTLNGFGNVHAVSGFSSIFLVRTWTHGLSLQDIVWRGHVKNQQQTVNRDRETFASSSRYGRIRWGCPRRYFYRGPFIIHGLIHELYVCIESKFNDFTIDLRSNDDSNNGSKSREILKDVS